MPLFNPVTDFSTAVGFYGVGPVARPTGYVNTFSTANKTLAAYSANTQSGAYTGGLLDLLQAARLSDVNTLRVAYENLRVFAENAVTQHNQLVADLKSMGLIG